MAASDSGTSEPRLDWATRVLGAWVLALVSLGGWIGLGLSIGATLGLYLIHDIDSDARPAFVAIAAGAGIILAIPLGLASAGTTAILVLLRWPQSTRVVMVVVSLSNGLIGAIGAVVVLRLDWSDQPSTWSILLIAAGLGAILGLALGAFVARAVRMRSAVVGEAFSDLGHV